MLQLSQNAQQLLQILKEKGGMWFDNATVKLFNKPTYPIDWNPEKQREFWQWEANQYGTSFERPVGTETVLFEPTDNYDRKTSAAYQELNRAGLADEKNNGLNCYWIFAK